jgi:hypothetical protein
MCQVIEVKRPGIRRKGLPAVKNGSMNILQMHIDHPNINNLPVLDIKDPF